MKKVLFIFILLVASVVMGASPSPFIFGQYGPITLQPLSGILMSVGNTITGGATSDNVPEGVTNLYLTFPLNAPAGTLTAPTLNFLDNDSGLWQKGDGNISFSANGFLRMEVNQNQVDVIGPLDVTGNISAANYPPSGSATSFAGFDGSGALSSIPGWTWNVEGAVNTDITKDIFTTSGYTFQNKEFRSETTGDMPGTTVYNLGYDFHYDRNNTGFDLDTFNGMSVGTRTEGSGFVRAINGINSFAQAGNGNGGGAETVQSADFRTVVATGTTITNSLNGVFVGISANSATADNGYLINSNLDNATFTNNYNSIITSANNSTFNNNFALFNGYTPNSNTFNGPNYYGVVIGNDAPIAGFAFGFHANMNGNMLQNITGHGFATNANTLSSSGYNMTGYDLNVNNTTFNGDGFNGFNGFISGVGATQTNVNGFSFTNNLSGTNRFNGVNIQNNQAQIEEIKILNLTSTGNARTISGIDMSITGVATDDARGMRINADNLTSTSTSQHPHALEVSGGPTQIFGAYEPFSGIGFEIGHNYSVNSHIPSGTPLTGSDQILMLQQANLLADDDISTGPFGLDTNMIGQVSQAIIASGKTVPLVRGLLVGTSVPGGSGGTITRYEAVTILGLPSFGGTVSNPTRIGLHFAGLLGQDFCGGANPATDCWGIYNPDSTAENFMHKIAISTSSQKVSTNVKLEINDGHIRHTQTTPPVATVNANAGTGAACSVSQATDHAGKISLTTTIVANANGSQCDVAFNNTFNVAPVCVFSPIESNAAINEVILGTYITTSTTQLSMNFTNADLVGQTYEWSYQCLETQ